MPAILKKTEREIVDEILSRSPFYTPEWEPGGQEDAGAALARIMARFGDTAISRLNIAPELHRLTFLEMIGARLLPAQPSRVPLTFFAPADAPGPCPVPERTQASADGSDGEPVFFETEKNLVVSPAQLVEFVAVNPGTDEILHHDPSIGGVSPATLFVGENAQEHSLYIGDSRILAVSDAFMTITVKGTGLHELTGPTVEWSYPREVIRQVDGLDAKVIEQHAVPVQNAAVTGSEVSFQLHITDRIAETEVRGIRSRWIRCTAKNAIAVLADMAVTSISLFSQSLIRPDLIFCDDIPVDPLNLQNDPVSPFGNRPFFTRSLYLSSADAFSKKDYFIQLAIEPEIPVPPPSPLYTLPSPRVSWEYWDGTSWMYLLTDPVDVDFSRAPVIVKISSLPGIRQVTVNGKENYWIRMRLTGAPPFDMYPFRDITISYLPQHGGSVPECIVTVNNQDVILRESVPFTPFSPVTDRFPALYLGFDKPLTETQLSLFFSVDPMLEYPEDFRPKLNWQYFSTGGFWKDLLALDETHGITRSGVIEISAPGFMDGIRLFGSDAPLFWLRARFTESFFEIHSTIPLLKAQWIPLTGIPLQEYFRSRSWILDAGRVLSEKFRIDLNATSRIPACPAPVDVINPSLFPAAVKKGFPPFIQGVFPNTTWALQSRTVPEEILGSGTGVAGRSYAVLHPPVISADIWIDEAGSLTPRDLEKIRIPGRFRETKDDSGKTNEFWVRWMPVEDLASSTESDRHFELDPASGGIIFGDGHHGTIPPLGLNNLRAAYQTGGGARGNLAPGRITSLSQTIAMIDSVSNPLAAAGACDIEDVKDLVSRAPQVLRHRGRAITGEDFESLAHDASREVARVGVLQNFNSEGKFQPGWVTVVIVPHSPDPQPIPTPELKRRVERFLKENSSNVIHLAIIQPSYLRVSVRASLFTRNLDQVPVITAEAKSRLSAFLHPLTGGEVGKGWPFGSIPCVSDIYAVLEGIDGLDHADSVGISFDPCTGAPQTNVSESMMAVRAPPYCLPFCGDLAMKTAWIPEGGP